MTNKEKYRYNKLLKEKNRLLDLLYYSSVDDEQKYWIKKMVSYLDKEMKILTDK